MSERVRKAMALDAIEETVARCGEHAKGMAEGAGHVQNELRFSVSGAVKEASAIYGIPYPELMTEALKMLRDGLRNALCGLCEVRYVKPYEQDGEVVGMMVRFYVRRVA